MSGLITLQSGQPFTVGCSVSTSASTGCNALLAQGQSLYAGAQTPAHWINASAFYNPAPVKTAGQTDLSPLGGAPTQAIGPGFHRADFSLAKQWRITEHSHLDFRAEVFNLTNTPNFAQPGSLNFSSTTNFAQITATRDNPDGAREIQFGLKFSF
jgi:hypothetical protein